METGGGLRPSRRPLDRPEHTALRLDLWLDNRRWWHREAPFPHVVARDVFRPTNFEAIEKSFLEILARGLSEGHTDAERFSRSMKGYDAYGYRLPKNIDGPLAVFASREWHDLVARLFGVRATEEIEIALHHHQPGGKTGWLHNDLNPGWFVRDPRPDGITLGDPALCNYHDGTPAKPGVEPVERIRAVALLFYLANPPWSAGDGGETGVYGLRTDSPERPFIAVPPINNSLLAFECTPYSFHTFIENRRSPRNSIVMWLHRPKEEVVARWGAAAIEPWKK
jgi:hypothetical protein